MIKQNGQLENLLVFQNSLSQDQYLFKYMYRVNWTEWVFRKLTGFQDNHFVCEGKGGMLGGVRVCVWGGVCVCVCVCAYMCVLVRFEW